jgi:predicted lipoprotein
MWRAFEVKVPELSLTDLSLLSRIAATVLALAATVPAAKADVSAALDQSILPGFARLAEATDALATTAQADCRAAAVLPAYGAAWDAWMGVAHLGIGPSNAANLTIAFWPDTRGATQKAVNAALASGDVPATAEAVKAKGAASRGLMALDALLGGAAHDMDSPACVMVKAVAADLAANTAQLDRDWQAFAPALRDAGAAGNTVYLTPDEARKALFTQLLAGLELAAEQRLGRPMGEPGKARPTRAEAWRTGRSVPNIRASLAALQGLAQALAGTPLAVSDKAFAAAFAALDRLPDSVLQDLADPQARLRAEVAQQRIRDVRIALETEMGAALGVKAGFNSLDGD